MKRQVAQVCIVLGLIVAGSACKKNSPLAYHTVALPGFTVQAPTPLIYQADLAANYHAGKVEWKDGSRRILVAWRRGIPMTADDVSVVVKAIGGLAPASVGQFVVDSGDYTASGLRGFQVTLKNSGYRIQFFEAWCGKRVVTFAVAAAAAEMPSLWAKLTGSIVCAPRAEQEAKLDTATPITPAEPELLAGWQREPDDASFIISNDDRVLVAQEVASFESMTTPIVQNLIAVLATHIGGTWVLGHSETTTGPFGRRDLTLGTLTVDQTEFHAVVSIFRCEGQSTGLMLLVMGDKASAQLGEIAELSTKIRCATPGDPPLRLAPSELPEGVPPTK